ncbi:PP0621 family protein [Trinickia dinghuensis]|uniref:Deaminase n=1 Tax=Trinickia dinghuensis TaxID=2291023 RepID=A0A3D8JQ26_9BURK|nr:PP0621 family protein [Trinickia dinghuensis]RDU94815.1 deaminase [Trinickia dinghuensis]
MRQIFLLVVFVLAARWLVKTMRAGQPQAPAAGRRGARSGPAHGTAGSAQREPPRLAEPMVRCAVCGVHAPQSDSVRSGAQYFCSAEHAQRYAARAGGREGR